MSWVRFDDQSAFHAKIVGAGNEAVGAWMRMTCWSASHLTDGDIPEAIAAVICGSGDVIERLIAMRMLDRVGDQLRIHDYLDHNPSAAEVLAKRKAELERKAAGRNNQQRDTAGRMIGIRNVSARNPHGREVDSLELPPVPSPSPSPIPNTEQKKPETDSARTPRFDFEAIWSLYPRKLKKAKGLKICVSRVKTPEQYAALERAVRNYARRCDLEAVGTRYILHFSTFMGEWEDWIEWTPEQPTQPQFKNFSQPMPHAAASGKANL